MADNILVQSGRRLSQQSDISGDFGKSFAEGSKLIDDQIRQNRKDRESAEDREWQLKRREQSDQLFEAGLESKMMTYNAEKAAVFSEIDSAIERGDLSGPDYELYQQNRGKWWKDQANQIKAQKDLVKVREKVKKVAAAEKNWGNILQINESLTPSNSGPKAQQMNYALSAWQKKNGQVPPPVVNEGGKLYFEIPTADGQDVVRIPLDRATSAKGPEDIMEDYEDRITFQDLQGKFLDQNDALTRRLNDGTATHDDLAAMETWFDKQIRNEAQVEELTDSLIQQLGGDVDMEALGIVDKTGNGLTKDDIDLDGSGIPGDSFEEKKIMKELFKSITSAQYGEQLYDKNDQGTFTEPQVTTYNAFAELYGSGGSSLNALQSLPGVHSFQVTKDGTQAAIFIGDNRDEKTAFMVPLENGAITPEGLDLLARKFELTDIRPDKGDNIEDEEVVETPTVEETDAENAEETVVGEETEVQDQQELYQEEVTGQAPIAINNSNFKGIKGVSQAMHNKVINALVGIRITKDNLPKIKEVIKGLKGKQFYNKQRNAIMEHIERLIKEGQ